MFNDHVSFQGMVSADRMGLRADLQLAREEEVSGCSEPASSCAVTPDVCSCGGMRGYSLHVTDGWPMAQSSFSSGMEPVVCLH